MDRIPPTSSSTISRALAGRRVSWTGREHLAVVAAFAREARRVLYGKERDEWTADDQQAMAAWLHRGAITVGGRSMKPIEALANERLARKALDELHRAT